MDDPRKALAVLKSARELVRGDWSTTNEAVEFEDADGQTCASIAIRCSCDRDDVAYVQAHVAVLRAAGVDVPTNELDIIRAVYKFNDMQTTRVAVLAAFDKAIATLEAEGEATPNADVALDVMAACETAGATIAAHIVSEYPHMDLQEITELVTAELFYAAQDTAKACSQGVKLERA